jgi:hypothetical protein
MLALVGATREIRVSEPLFRRGTQEITVLCNSTRYMRRPLSFFRRDAPGIAEVLRTGVEGPQPAPERSLKYSRLGA